MPTYEYACEACGNEWEFEQSIREDAIKKCPKCGKDRAKRQISRGTGFILKGSGWYSDLYSSPSGSKKAADGGSSDSASDSSGASTPAKPEAASSGGDKSGSGTRSGVETSPPAATSRRGDKSRSGAGGGSSGGAPVAAAGPGLLRGCLIARLPDRAAP